MALFKITNNYRSESTIEFTYRTDADCWTGSREIWCFCSENWETSHSKIVNNVASSQLSDERKLDMSIKNDSRTLRFPFMYLFLRILYQCDVGVQLGSRPAFDKISAKCSKPFDLPRGLINCNTARTITHAPFRSGGLREAIRACWFTHIYSNNAVRNKISRRPNLICQPKFWCVFCRLPPSFCRFPTNIVRAEIVFFYGKSTTLCWR